MNTNDPRNFGTNDPFRKINNKGGQITEKSLIESDSWSNRRLVVITFFFALPIFILSIFLFVSGLKILSAILFFVFLSLILIGLLQRILLSKFDS